MASAVPSEVRERLRALPSVQALAERLDAGGAPEAIVVDAARRAIEAERRAILGGHAGVGASLLERARELLARERRPALAGVINATGIVLHTGLGRSPLAREAVQALADVAAGYAPVEIDIESGKRNRRSDVVRGLLTQLTGAEAATVVNNNAAALVLTLSTLAKGREVIVSRGELIEIGGSFRLPDVIESGGAILRAVGTTNKTKLADYQEAIGEHTGAILKMHTSNYRIEGFTQDVPIDELASLGRARAVPVIHDTGSGLLTYPDHPAISDDEPDARASIEAGADLVLFSADKLLGGPQAGIIVGGRDLVERVEANALARALRVDKLVLAALGATLRLYRDAPELTSERIPVRALLEAPVHELERRARAIRAMIEAPGHAQVEVVVGLEGFAGGGSAPADAIESAGLRVRSSAIGEAEIGRRLRLGEPGVVGRVVDESVVLDLRAVFPEQDEALARRISAALRGEKEEG